MGRRMIVAKVEALGFELSPVVGQTFVSPQPSQAQSAGIPYQKAKLLNT